MARKNISSNPFCKNQKGINKLEVSQHGFFMFATYFILICALAIFGKIIYEGVPVLTQRGWSFVSHKPQTLSVVDAAEAGSIEAPVANFENMLRSNDDDTLPIDNLEEFEKTFEFIRFDLQPGSVIGEGYLKNLEKQNKDFYLIYTERDASSDVGFTLESDKNISLKTKQFERLRESAPALIPAGVSIKEITLTDYKVTIEKGEYPLRKDGHDALVPTNLVFQMRQGFPDDEPDKICLCVIPETQTITIDSNSYFAAFDEDEKGTLPVANQVDIPHKTLLHQFTLKAGSYSSKPKALAIMSSQGIGSQHNLRLGSIIVNLEKPQTLSLPKTEYAQLIADNPALKIENVTSYEEKADFIRFSLTKDAEIRLDTEDLEALTLANKESGVFKILSEHTHSYSGGGILGPIVGTALLVTICMIVALSTGIASATFLNEYARKGPFTKSVRLAMLNLAGVPSIVFGLFGLGLFVMLAPSLTDTPHYDSKLCIPLAPFASQPDLRTVEQKRIHIETRELSTSEVISAAQADEKEFFYDGWIYISFQGWGTCMLAGGFTLAIMVLPVIITSCEESLRAVPMGFREASLALGASKWQSIRTAVLPYAMPGILTASVLGITRVAGETAPIMFTASAAERSDLPWQGLQSSGFGAFIEFLQQSVQALPYHIYTVAGRIPQSEYTEPMQFGSVLVFMIIVMALAGLSIWLRVHFRNKIKW